MTLKEIIKALEDYMEASLGVNGEITDKAKQALKELKDSDWRPLEDLPPVDEDGYSEKLLVSFANFSLPYIGEYR